MAEYYEVIMDGGGPWGIRLQGGKDFGVPLNVARVTPGSNASKKGLLAGDHIISINNNVTENLTHMEAQNLIKGAGNTLQLRLKKGTGTSLGEAKSIGAGGFKPEAQQTLYTTDVTHSAGVDHKYNSKPKTFITSTGGSAGGVTHVSTPMKSYNPEDSRKNDPVKKFDPGEYARKKKEELESYKKDSTKPHVDSDVLQMLKKTSVTDPKPTSGLSHGAPDCGGQPEGDVAFRMTADGTDLSDVSPGSRAVMEDIKTRGTTTLSSGGAASGGSRSFRMLQHITSLDEDLPPPPPDLMGDFDDGDGSSEPQVQSHTFKMLQHHVDAGTADQVLTGLDKQKDRTRNLSTGSSSSGGGQPMGRQTTQTTVTVNPIPKAPFPTGPNFKVGRAAAPTFKSSSSSHIGPKAPPPPAVNAGEIVNPNSRLYQANAQPVAQPNEDYGRARVGSQEDQGYGPKFSNNAPQSSPPSYGREQSQPREQTFSPQREQPHSPPQNSGAGRGPPSQSGEKKLVCQACDQPMTGPFVSAIGKTWHPEHFCCSSCHISLQNQAFVEENCKLFCEKCYNQFYAPKCAHCNNAIIGNCVNALGKSWHPDHFICSFCNKSFGNDGFLVDNGRPYCGKCFDDLFSVKCGKCGQPITGGEKYVEALNKNWHSTCFSCNYCNVRLEGNSFYVNRGMAYCQQHKSAVL